MVDRALHGRGEGPVVLRRDEDEGRARADLAGPGVDGRVGVAVFREGNRLVRGDDGGPRGDGERAVGEVEHGEACVGGLGENGGDG